MTVENAANSRIGVKVISSLMGFPPVRRGLVNVVHRRIDQEADKRRTREEGLPELMLADQRQMLHNLAGVAEKWAAGSKASRATAGKAAAGRFVAGFASLFRNEDPTKKEFTRVHGTEPPSFLTIGPTQKCNLTCTGCYASSCADSAPTLDFDVVDRIFREQKELWGSHFTVITGGEPFMYKSRGMDIIDLAGRHPDRYFLVYTNGTLINAHTARRLAEVGNITPAVSVEGFAAETDARRGTGVHARVLKAFENMRQAGVLFGISTTATRNNAELLLSREFIDYYFKEQGAGYMWIFQYMPIGRSYTLDLMVTPEQRVNMLKRTRELMYDEQLFIADFWNSATISTGCISAGKGEGKGYIYIDWNGNVMPCVFNPYTTDNILDVYASGGNLNDVLFSPLMKRIREWQSDYFSPSSDNFGNLLTPCPIRDHHAAMRKILDDTNAQPADESAAAAIEDEGYYEGMCCYGEQVDALTRDIWEDQFLASRPEDAAAPRQGGGRVIGSVKKLLTRPRQAVGSR